MVLAAMQRCRDMRYENDLDDRPLKVWGSLKVDRLERLNSIVTLGRRRPIGDWTEAGKEAAAIRDGEKLKNRWELPQKIRTCV
jgi:hypothetical protein